MAGEIAAVMAMTDAVGDSLDHATTSRSTNRPITAVKL